MSYDINFWKQERALALSAEEIYGQLSRGEPVEGLARLPVDEILGRLRERLPGFDPKAEFPDVDVENGNIEFAWSDQHFRFDLRGEVPAAQQNALVEIMQDYGCPLYDPQVNTRYDTSGGTAIGKTPVFEDPTPEQRAQLEKMKADLLGKLSGQEQKKDYAGSAAIILATIASIAWVIGRQLGGAN